MIPSELMVKAWDTNSSSGTVWTGPTWSVGVGEVPLKITIESFMVPLPVARGAGLPDPEKVFNSRLEGNKRRATYFREGEDINEGAINALVRALVALNSSRMKLAAARLFVTGRRRP